MRKRAVSTVCTFYTYALKTYAVIYLTIFWLPTFRHEVFKIVQLGGNHMSLSIYRITAAEGVVLHNYIIYRLAQVFGDQ